MMPNHLCAPIEGRFEGFPREFILENFASITRDIAPHVGDDDNVVQCCVTTKFVERLEILSSDSNYPGVKNAVDIDDPGERRPSPISGERFRQED